MYLFNAYIVYLFDSSIFSKHSLQEHGKESCKTVLRRGVGPVVTDLPNRKYVLHQHHPPSVYISRLKTTRGTSFVFMSAILVYNRQILCCPGCEVISSVRAQEDHVPNSLTFKNVQMGLLWDKFGFPQQITEKEQITEKSWKNNVSMYQNRDTCKNRPLRIAKSQETCYHWPLGTAPPGEPSARCVR